MTNEKDLIIDISTKNVISTTLLFFEIFDKNVSIKQWQKVYEITSEYLRFLLAKEHENTCRKALLIYASIYLKFYFTIKCY